MAISNPSFIRDRKNLEEKLKEFDPEGNYISQIPFENPMFVVNEAGRYQLLGVNSNFVDSQYIEIFVAIDLNTTLSNFDGRAVKTFYFNQNTIENVFEIPESEAKKGVTRPEWRRLQKYLKKEAKNIVKNNKYTEDETK